MRHADIDYLLSPVGQAILQSLSTVPITPNNHLTIAANLRAQMLPEQAAIILETALLRQKAGRKFSRAGEMLFTREGLEQATSEIVAAYRATRYSAAGVDIIADMGCGIGGDAIALAKAAQIIAIDSDQKNARLAKFNATVYDVGDRVWPIQGDLEQLPAMKVDAFFFDPARRTPSGPRLPPSRRLYATDEYIPPIRTIDAWRTVVKDGAIKASPAIDYGEIPEDAEVEFVSLNGELKEAVLWFGGLRSGAGQRATLLPGATFLEAGELPPVRSIAPPASYLFEPDPAVIRAHLVGQLANILNAAFIDPEIAYLTAERPQATPFARCYRIEDYFPFQLKRLRGYLREHNIGQITIKKRGSPLDPEELRQALRLKGNSHRILFLTQSAGQPVVMIGQPWVDSTIRN